MYLLPPPRPKVSLTSVVIFWGGWIIAMAFTVTFWYFVLIWLRSVVTA